MVVVCMCISILLASIATSMANIVLPAISMEFETSISTSKWIVLSYLLTMTIFSLVIGRLSDLKGRRVILFWGAGIFAFGALASATTSSLWLLILFRTLQGVGGAALVVLPITYVSELVARENSGKIIGLLSTMSAVGTALGPLLASFLLSLSGWRTSFSLVAAIGLLNFLLIIGFVPIDSDFRSDEKARVTLSFDLSVSVRLMSNLIVAAVMMSTLIAGPFYLSNVLRIAPFEMGLVMSAGPVASIFFGYFSGMLVDRFGNDSILRFGFFQLFIGMLAFALLPTRLGSYGFALSAVFLSLGYQLFLSANTNSIIDNVAPETRGSASGALSLSRNLGLLSGTFLAGSAFESFGLQTTFIVYAALTAPIFCFLYSYSRNFK